MTCYVFPTSYHVAELLSRWLAMPITCREQRRPTKIPPPVAVAVYEDDNEAVAACILCDWPAANYLGRADGLPAPAAPEEREDEDEDLQLLPIGERVVDNLRTVFEACVNLFMDPHSPPLRLRNVLLPSTTLVPAHVADSIRQASERLHIQIDVPRSGRGHLTLVVV